MGTTTPSKSGTESNGNEGVLTISREKKMSFNMMKSVYTIPHRLSCFGIER